MLGTARCPLFSERWQGGRKHLLTRLFLRWHRKASVTQRTETCPVVPAWLSGGCNGELLSYSLGIPEVFGGGSNLHHGESSSLSMRLSRAKRGADLQVMEVGVQSCEAGVERSVSGFPVAVLQWEAAGSALGWAFMLWCPPCRSHRRRWLVPGKGRAPFGAATFPRCH